MKVYRGRRTPDGCIVTVIENDQERPLDLRHDLRNHSPDGANWGYGGSGPAQLALGLCADVLGDDERAQEVYQPFKFRVIGRLAGDEWELCECQVKEAIDAIEAGA